MSTQKLTVCTSTWKCNPSSPVIRDSLGILTRMYFALLGFTALSFLGLLTVVTLFFPFAYFKSFFYLHLIDI